MSTLTLEEALELRDPTHQAMQACAHTLMDAESDVWDVAEIFDKLREWLRRDLDSCQKLLGDLKLQATIVSALQHHGANLEVARLGCGVVAGCCQKSNQNASLMLRAGVVQEILDLMDTHCDDGIAQDNACVALWRLAERNGSGAEDIVQAGGMDRLFRAMKDHMANPFVQVNACYAMERLYLKGGAPINGMREAADQAMEAHPSNTQIKRGAKRLIDVLEKSPPPQPEKAMQKSQPQTSARLWQQSAGWWQGPDSKAMPLHEWLMELDDVGFLMEYHNGLKRNFDSLNQVIDVYASDGALDPRFFHDLKVEKLGHRRLFQKWVRDNVPQTTLRH